MTMKQSVNEIQDYFEKECCSRLYLHGGNASITEITDDGVVYVRLYGACADCPSASQTAEYAIRQVLLAKFPELTDVVIDQSVSQDLIDQARAILFGGSDKKE